jgi:type VII secretion protein EccB
MQSKRDQVQAHSFIMSRLTSGMLLADPDAADSPLGRTTRGFLVGILIAVMVSAGAFVFGLLVPGGKTSWKTSGGLIVNKDTGGRYLYLDGRLRPVRNYASARLLGGSGLKATDVGTASLRDTPVGVPVGIPGAPDNIPAAGDLDSGAWQVCSTVLRTVDQQGGAGTPTPLTSVVAGSADAGEGLGTGQGLVVTGPDKVSYLVWQGSRLKLDKATGAALSLGYGSVAPRGVSAAFLDALVSGPALVPKAVSGRGGAGPRMEGNATTVGQVFQVRVPGANAQYYLLREEGLVPLTDTGAALALGDPATREKAYGGDSPRAAVLGADALKQHLAPGSEGTSPATDGLPVSPPKAVDVPAGASACARVEPGSGGTRVTTVLVPTGLLSPVAQVSRAEVAEACLPVDAVIVRPGHGALVRALGAGGTTVGDTTYLVGDTGAKYRIPTADALSALGYQESQIKALPSPLLAMLPTGPDLDPKAAAGAAKPSVTAGDCGSAGQGTLVPGGLSGGSTSIAGTAAVAGSAAVPAKSAH